jgi:O-antigen/teichoic acid export membrane protein
LTAVSDQKPVEVFSRKSAMKLQALGGYFNTGINVVQGLALIPLYLNYLGLNLYGLWVTTGGILAMLGVMNLGLGSLLVQRVALSHGQQDFCKAGEYFINGLVVYLFLASMLVGVGLLLSFNLSEIIKEVGRNETLIRQCFQMAVVATGLGFINECLRSFASALLRPLYSALALAGARIVGLALTVYLLFHEAGLWAIPVGMLVVEVLVLPLNLVQAITLFRGLGARVELNREYIKDYFQTGGLLFASRLGHAFSRDADPLLITLFLRADVTAVYMVTRKAADVVFQLLSVIYASANGSFSHLVGTGDNLRIGRVAGQLLAMMFLVSLIGYSSYTALNAEFVSLWVGNALVLNQGVIMLIGVAYFLNSLRNMVLTILNAHGEFNYSSRFVLVEGLIKTCMTGVFLHWVGISGAPLALILASAVTLIILGSKLHKLLRVSIKTDSYIMAVATSLLLLGLASLSAHFLTVDSWWQFAFYSAFCVTVAALITVWFNWRAFRPLINGDVYEFTQKP